MHAINCDDENMSNDLSLPRPGRLQARKRTRVGRKRCPRERDPAPMNPDYRPQDLDDGDTGIARSEENLDDPPAPMNMNATAQMVMQGPTIRTGWGYQVNQADHRAHYFDRGDSLCGKKIDEELTGIANTELQKAAAEQKGLDTGFD